MNRLLNYFRGFFSTKASQNRRPSPRRLGLESLETREVPAVCSTALHAVALPAQTSTSAAFMINPVDHCFYEKTPTNSIFKVSEANEVESFSAGTTATGTEDVFVHFNDGSFFEFDPQHDFTWTNLNPPTEMSAFAAVDGSRVYAVGGADHSMWSYSPPSIVILGGKVIHLGGWTQISGPGTVTTLDAVSQTNGQDVVYFRSAITGNLLEDVVGSTGQFKVVATKGSYTTFAAGLDASGNGECWFANITSTTSDLFCHHTAQGTNVHVGYALPDSTTDPYSFLSATHDGHVFTKLGTEMVSYGDTANSASTGYSVFDPTFFSAASIRDYYTISSGNLVETIDTGVFGFTITRKFGGPGGEHW